LFAPNKNENKKIVSWLPGAARMLWCVGLEVGTESSHQKSQRNFQRLSTGQLARRALEVEQLLLE
jgi:hypothetical protein